MKQPLWISYLTAFLLSAVLLLLLVHTWGVSLISDTLISDRKAALYEEASALSERYFFNLDSIGSVNDQTETSLRERLKSLQTMSKARYFLVDSTGRISVDSSARKNLEGQNFNDINPTFLDHDAYIGTLNHSTLSEETLSVIYPLSEDHDVSGYLVIMTSLANLRASARRTVADLSLCLVVFFAVLFLLLTVLYRMQQASVRAITKAARQYGSGHFTPCSGRLYGKEYFALMSSLKALAKRAKNSGDYQKDFVANVSHDFRSPLTSIKGYTEAILDGTIPDALRGKYLKIILRETERLQKLTEQLLELNKYENGGILLHYTTFDINEVIRNAASSFEKQCTEKHISVQLLFSASSLYVDADRDKISQVIQNLLDNAIKFSSQGSSIEIQTTERRGKAFVTVSDHGIGIPEQSLSQIWNRFYKTDVSRGKDKTGSGLGLAITREILDAHHEYIHVSSILGSGSDFSFTLTLHTTTF